MTETHGGPLHCVFCGIAAGTVPADVVYRDYDVLAFRDIHPQAAVHCLIIPTQHIVSLNELESLRPGVGERLLQVAVMVAREQGITESGYRLTTNVGRDAGQSVNHLHFHLLGGNRLRLALG
ncbi:MAG TPA: histidine triad nucleotide-binding protein [Thermomicrobiaceae bacterium]|nr:histidine triad nucleotide-binding protein [Thermomicrobiaceae bacterium]